MSELSSYNRSSRGTPSWIAFFKQFISGELIKIGRIIGFQVGDCGWKQVAGKEVIKFNRAIGIQIEGGMGCVFSKQIVLVVR